MDLFFAPIPTTLTLPIDWLDIGLLVAFLVAGLGIIACGERVRAWADRWCKEWQTRREQAQHERGAEA